MSCGWVTYLGILAWFQSKQTTNLGLLCVDDPCSDKVIWIGIHIGQQGQTEPDQLTEGDSTKWE